MQNKQIKLWNQMVWLLQWKSLKTKWMKGPANAGEEKILKQQ